MQAWTLPKILEQLTEYKGSSAKSIIDTDKSQMELLKLAEQIHEIQKKFCVNLQNNILGVANKYCIFSQIIYIT